MSNSVVYAFWVKICTMLVNICEYFTFTVLCMVFVVLSATIRLI